MSKAFESFAKSFLAPKRAEQGTTWADDARTVGISVLDVGSSLAGAAQYLSGGDEDGTAASVRKFFAEQSESIFNNLTPEAQREMTARIIPNGEDPSIWDDDVSMGGALYRQTLAAVPSIVASLLPGALVARVAGATAGAATAYGSASAMTGGGVFDRLQTEIMNASEEELMESPLYRGLIEARVTPERAREVLAEENIGYKPLIQAAITAASIRVFGGLESRIGGAGARGSRTSQALRAGRGEALQEGSETASSEALVQLGLQSALGRPLDPVSGLDATLRGAAVGAVSGAGLGAVMSRRPGEPANDAGQEQGQQDTGVDPDQQLALGDGQADLFGGTNTRRAPVAEPEATPEPRDPNQADLFGDADQDSTSTDAGDPDVDLEVVRQRARTPRKRSAPTVNAPGAPAPDQAAALAAANAQVEAARQSSAQGIQAVNEQLAQITPAAPTAQAPLQPPVSAAGVTAQAPLQPPVSAAGVTAQAPTIDTPAAQPAPALPPEVTPAAVQDTAPVVEPVQEIVPVQEAAPPLTDSGRRVLTDLQAEQRVRQAEEARAKEASRGVALAEQAEAKQGTRATARGKRVGAAQDIISNSPGPTEAEAGYSKGSRDPQLYAFTKARLDALIGAVEQADAAAKKGEPKVKIPAEGRKGTPANISFLARARKIRDRIAAGDLPSAGDMATLIGDEKLVRGGSADVAQAGRTGASNMRGSGKVSGESDGTGEAAPAQVNAADPQSRLEQLQESNEDSVARVDFDVAADLKAAKVIQDAVREARRAEEIPTLTKPVTAVVETAKRRKFTPPPKTVSPAIAKVQENAARKKLSLARTAAADAVIRGEATQVTAAEAEVAAPSILASVSQRGTDAFKRWFGKSKVVDAAGNPLVVYHGTNEDFDAFSTAMQGATGGEARQGFFFTSSADEASGYAGWSGGNVVPVYLALQNPVMLDYAEHGINDIIEADADLASLLDKSRSLMSRMRGKDGLILKDIGGIGGPSLYVAFKPTQIKSATGNRGTYDPTNPSITASVRARDTRGLITTPAGRNSAANVRANPQSVAKGKPMTLGARLLPLIGANPGGIQGEIWRRMVGDLRKLVSDVPVYVTDDAGMLAATADMLESGKLEGIADGFYDPATNIIMLNQAALADPVNRGNLILHEATHAALHNLIETNAEVRADLNAILEEAQTAFDGLTELAGQRAERPYGLSSVHELVSEALSNPDFQSTLMNFSASPELSARFGLEQQRPSLWNTLVELVRKHVFGSADGPPTLFEAVLRATEKTMAIRMQQGAVSRAGGAPVASMSARGAQAQTDLGYMARAFGGKTKRFGMRLATLGGLSQQLDQQALVPGASANLKRFAELARTFTDTVLTTSNIRRKTAEEGNEVVQDWARLRKNNLEGYRATEAVIRALHNNNTAVIDKQNWTEQDLLDANKHVSKKRRSDVRKIKDMIELQNKFMALPSEFRTHHLKTQKFLEKKMAFTARQEIMATLEAVPPEKLDATKRADLAERVYNGRMTEDDKKLINNDIIYKHLRSTRNLRKPNGTYMPAMRFGKFRVRALAPSGDLMGGKEIAPDTIEFRMATDKEAWAATEKFMVATDLDITGHLSRVFYDKNTGELLDSEDAKRMDESEFEVGIRVPVQRQHLYSFDSEVEAMQFIDDHRSTFEEIDPEPLVAAKTNISTELSGTQLGSILKEIESAGHLTPEAKKEASIALYQASLKMMNGVRFQQRRIISRKVGGASTDMVRVLHSYNDAFAGYFARKQTLPQANEALAQMKAMQKNTRSDEENVQRSNYIAEFAARFDGVRDYQDPNQLVRDLLTLSFNNYLASPAYSIINSTQVAMVSYPELAGTYGPIRAAAAIVKAYNIAGGMSAARGVTNTLAAVRQYRELGLETDSALELMRANIARQPNGAFLLRVLDHIEGVGLLDTDAGLEMSADLVGSRGKFGDTLARVTRIFRQMPQVVEIYNRVVPAIAAADLYTQRKPGDEKGAFAYARKIVEVTQGDYSAANTSPLMNKYPIITQFQKFPQMMAQMLLFKADQAFNGATPEDKKIAIRQLSYLAGMQVAVGGAVGLPMLELVKIPVMLAGLLGVGEGWEPWERWMEEVVAEVTDSEAFGKAFMRGLITRPLGIDVSSRINLGNLAVGFTGNDYDRDSVHAYIAERLLGAPGTMLTGFFQAAQRAGDGEWGRALPDLIPLKVVADSIKAYTDDELSLPGRVSRAIGIMPASTAEKFEEFRKDGAERTRLRKQQQLFNRRWRRTTNTAERRALRREIEEFNDRVPYYIRTRPWNWTEQPK